MKKLILPMFALLLSSAMHAQDTKVEKAANKVADKTEQAAVKTGNAIEKTAVKADAKAREIHKRKVAKTKEVRKDLNSTAAKVEDKAEKAADKK